MLTENPLVTLVPLIFIIDLVLTVAVIRKKVKDRNVVPVLRILLMGLGVASSWILFFNYPSLGHLFDYIYGSILVYFLVIRVFLLRS